jgi:hypothetical protein
MRSRVFATLAALAAAAVVTVGATGALGSALGGGSDHSPSSSVQAGKTMPRANT